MKILVDCIVCGWPTYKEKSDINRGRKPTCSKECTSVLKRKPRNQSTKPCTICGNLVTRAKSSMKNKVCCDANCYKIFQSQNMSRINVELNPDRMVLETREKLRESQLGRGEGKAYRKTYGRHTHRIVAEEILGRPLKKGEVVHHEDENKLNNDPSNIRIFASQAEHARHHALKRRLNAKKK